MKTIDGKVVVLGAQGVGKTSIVVRYVGKTFNAYVSPTVGASFFTCKVTIDNVRVKLQVWDTAGQERFKAMMPMYYRNANAAILIFDITDRDTFNSIKVWVSELKRNVEENLIICVVGNKIDLTEKRQVQRIDALAYAKSINATYFETSALEDQGIDQVFFHVALSLIRLAGEDTTIAHSTLRVYETDENGIPMNDANIIKANHQEIGRTESASWSIDSIAHADTFKPNSCC